MEFADALPLGAAVLRILDEAGEAVGAGFLLAPDRAVTCAHVVAVALGADPEDPLPPGDPLAVDFPLAPDPVPRVARVVEWQPIRPDGTGDVATLQLSAPAPEPARVPPLHRAESLWGHEFRALGFPGGMQDGTWVAGHLRARQGTGWTQLQAAAHGPQVTNGFSGAPVWDAELSAVVGMAVAADAGGSGAAYLIPIEEVIGGDPGLLPNPYRGLEPFEEEHAALFHGRDADVARVVEAIRRRPVVAVAGRSGVGKSSLVKAGVLPVLRKAGHVVHTFRAAGPGGGLDALVAAVRPEPDPTARPAAAPQPARDRGGPSDVVAELAACLAERAGSGLVLFADQVEELAAADPTRARELLEALIAVVAAGPSGADGEPLLRVVLTLRWEALNDLLTGAIAEALDHETVAVAPMSRPQLRAAVVGPARYAPGLYFAPGLVDRILDDTGDEPGQLPLLQSLLTQLWAARRGGVVGMAEYEELGGVPGALRTHAEQVLQTCTAEEREGVRRLCTRLARPGPGDAGFVRTAVDRESLPRELRALADRWVAHRLLVSGVAPDGTVVVEFAHQALIDQWPRLRGWLADDRAFLGWRHQVAEQHARWTGAGEDAGALLRGSALATAQEWLDARPQDVPEGHRRFIRAGARRRRREIRRWQLVTAVLLVLVLAAGVLTAAVLRSNAELAAALAAVNARTLAEASGFLAPDDPGTATQLALAAYRSDPQGPEARTALGRQFLATISADRAFTGLTDVPIDAFAISADGAAMLVPHSSGWAVVAGIGGESPRTWPLPGMPRAAVVALAPDGRRVAAVGPDGALLVWDVPGRSGPVVLLPGGSGPPPAPLLFSPDGRRVGWVTNGGVRVWDVVDAVPVAHRVPPDPGRSAALPLADPDLVLVRSGRAGTAGTRLVLHRLSTGAQLRVLPTGATVVARGAAVVTCAPGAGPEPANGRPGTDALLQVSDTRDGRPLRTIAVNGPDGCNPLLDRLVESVDGGHVLSPVGSSTGHNAAIAVRSLTDGTRFELFLPTARGFRLPSDSTDPSSLARSATVGVFAGQGGAPVVVSAHGATVLRYDGPFPRSAVDRTTSGRLDLQAHPVGRVADGRIVVAQESSTDAVPGDFVFLDAASGRELGRIDGAAIPTEGGLGALVDDDHLVVTTSDATGLQVQVLVHTVPDGRLVERYAIPRPPPTGTDALQGMALDVHLVGERMIALAGGALSVWDRATGALLAGPVQLGETPEETNWFRQPIAGNTRVLPRPGHPDQITLAARDGALEVWDVRRMSRIDRLPTDIARARDQYGIDPGGRTVAFLDGERRLHVWDIDTRAPLRSPIAVGEAARVLGMDDRGNAVLAVGPDGGFTLWNVHNGRQVGPFHPGVRPMVFGDQEFAGPGGLTIGAFDPVDVPFDPQAWFDHVCAVQDRPFTAAERALLPPGADPAPPCGAGPGR